MHDAAMLIAFTVGSVLLHIAADRRKDRAGRLLTKATASSGFITIALSLGALESPWGQLLLVALCLSTLGDLVLALRDTSNLVGGLVSLLLAHIAFGAAFVVLGVDVSVALVIAAAFAVIARGLVRWILPHVSQGLRLAAIAHIVASSGMATLALSASWSTGNVAIGIAGAAFFISDLLLARDRFIAPGPSNRLFGLPLYYGAQILFALQAAPPTPLTAC